MIKVILTTSYFCLLTPSSKVFTLFELIKIDIFKSSAVDIEEERST
jgi:hypothetical protein